MVVVHSTVFIGGMTGILQSIRTIFFFNILSRELFHDQYYCHCLTSDRYVCIHLWGQLVCTYVAPRPRSSVFFKGQMFVSSWDTLPLEMKPLRGLEMVGDAHPATECNGPESKKCVNCTVGKA